MSAGQARLGPIQTDIGIGSPSRSGPNAVEAGRSCPDGRRLGSRFRGEWLRSVVAGHANYFAVPGNLHRVGQFYCGAIKHWLHAIRRRSQKGMRLAWSRVRRLIRTWLPSVRILHPYPNVRFCVAHPR